MILPAPCSIENTPPGSPQAPTARQTAVATSSAVPGWPLCALTITGLPVASADAVSPPATENARGKLLEPKTTTGPSGTSIRRRSGLGTGWRLGAAWSIRASTQEPSRATWANSLSWFTVRARSPVSRARGRPVSRCARVSSSSPSATISSAMRSSRAARCSPVVCRRTSKAAPASRSAESTSCAPAAKKSGSSSWLSSGLLARKVSPAPGIGWPAIRLRPCIIVMREVTQLSPGCAKLRCR